MLPLVLRLRAAFLILALFMVQFLGRVAAFVMPASAACRPNRKTPACNACRGEAAWKHSAYPEPDRLRFTRRAR
jgi:hypothetical protein